MFLEHLPALSSKAIVLASASPRRAELLRQIGLPFRVQPSTFEENLAKSAFGSPAAYATATALHKGLDVCAAARSSGALPDLIISADTVVEVNGEVLEKATDAADAVQMLQKLSGRQHHVHTGVALIIPQPGDSEHVESFSESTLVEMDAISYSALTAYVNTGEAFGKAGSYGIQGPAGAWVKSISGCYFNIVGLPLHAVAAGITGLVEKGLL